MYVRDKEKKIKKNFKVFNRIQMRGTYTHLSKTGESKNVGKTLWKKTKDSWKFVFFIVTFAF